MIVLPVSVVIAFSEFVLGYSTNGDICESALYCIKEYLLELNYATPPYPSYGAIVGLKAGVLRNGTRGLEKLCSIQLKFQNCMASDQQCLNGTAHFLANQLQISDEAARDYQIYFAENVYECGTGRRDLLDNLQCFRDHQNESVGIMTKCRRLSLPLRYDPSRRCKRAVNLTTCLRDGFRAVCRVGAGEFMCNEEKVALRSSGYADCEPQLKQIECGAVSIGTLSLAVTLFSFILVSV
ncbi:hypothetical protein L596_011263 [Steinernema carpocapsae]|uniref:DUF19 domain-containing protein n=1 Tax=Steinernema carpocapsae TaxID=34508 RepID=A0A4U5NTT3_STECR|nr:hypothetical protein L596_011263 [Steinernema carpocapsae]